MVQSDNSPNPPPFIQPPDITSLNDAELDALIEGIRFRRMQSRAIYDETMQLKEKIKFERIKEALAKDLEKLHTEIVKFEKHIEKLEIRVNKVRAWRLQLGD